jgi:hypothetical protein
VEVMAKQNGMNANKQTNEKTETSIQTNNQVENKLNYAVPRPQKQQIQIQQANINKEETNTSQSGQTLILNWLQSEEKLEQENFFPTKVREQVSLFF